MALSPLPYDMGNAGDLLKHGLLAEWTRWWCERNPPPATLRFLDPFGGRPWADAPNPEVTRRLHLLSGTAIGRVFEASAGRYLGSGHLVREAAGGRAEVSVSDRLEAAREALEASGLRSLKAPGFDANDAYSVLDACADADLVLIDPFAEFIVEQAAVQLPRVARATRTSTVALLALDGAPGSPASRAYESLRDEVLPRAFRARCPRLPGTSVRGEAKYEAEVLLVASESSADVFEASLAPELEAFCERLSRVLGVSISVSRPSGR